MKKLILVAVLCLFGCAAAPSVVRSDIPTMSESVVFLRRQFFTQRVESKKKCKRKDCSTPKLSPDTYYSTGVIIGIDPTRQETLILTAGHFCRDEDLEIEPETKVVINIFVAQNFHHDLKKADVLKISAGFDACFLRADGIIGPPVVIDNDFMPIGSSVLNIGFPAGIVFDFGTYFGEGKFMGTFRDPRFEGPSYIFNLPTVPGLSGSPVFLDGKVVAITYAVNGRFEHITYAVPLSGLAPEIEEVMRR